MSTSNKPCKSTLSGLSEHGMKETHHLLSLSSLAKHAWGQVLTDLIFPMGMLYSNTTVVVWNMETISTPGRKLELSPLGYDAREPAPTRAIVLVARDSYSISGNSSHK